tara:strand:+ start:180036 stop:182210 length:2175 start_codon:yes stop_codon:yes gene_type:complete
MNKFIAYCLIVAVIVVGIFAFKSIKINSNLEEYMQSSEKELEEYLSLNDHFNSTDEKTSVLILERSDGWDNYSDFLQLNEATEYWEQQADVISANSIVNLSFPRKQLLKIKTDLLVPLGDEQQFKNWFNRKHKFPDVTPKFLSKDLSYALIYIRTEHNQISDQVWIEFDRWLSKNNGIEAHHIDKDLVRDHLEAAGISNVTLISVLAVILIIITFYIFTRSLSGLWIILIGISFNLSLTAISMWILDVHFSLYMISVPCIIIVLSFTDLMHLLYYHSQISEGLNMSEIRKVLIKRIGLPMLITSLSNIIGFVAFIIFAKNELLFHMAIISLIGVSVAFLNSRFVVPYLLSPRQKYVRSTLKNLDRKHFALIEYLSSKHRLVKPLVLSSFGILVILTINMFGVDWDDNYLVETGSDVHETRKILNDEFYGDKNAEVYITYDEEIWTHERLLTLQKVEHMIDSIFNVSYINSPVLIAKRFNRFLYNGHSGAFRLSAVWSAKRKDEISRSLALLGGQDLFSPESNYARIKFGFHSGKISETLKQYEDLSNYLERVSRSDLKFTLTGKGVLSDKTVWSFTINVFSGIFLALMFSMLILFVLKRSAKLFLGVLIVNALPILLVSVIMFALGFYINPLTIFLLSVLIGVCIDDTVYMILSYDQGMKVHYLPILVTSLVLAIAFTSLVAAGYNYLKVFSLLFLVGIIVAYLLDVFILPLFLDQTDKIKRID